MQVRNQNDFNRLRALALLSDVFTDKEVEEFMQLVFDEYYPQNPALQPLKEIVREKTMHEFDIYEPYPGFMEEMGISESAMWAGIYADWWETYVWEAISHWSIRADNPLYFKSFEYNIDKAMRKMSRSFSNTAINMVRQEMINLSELVEDNPPIVYDEENNRRLQLHIQFTWQSKEDKKVCSVCNRLTGTTLNRIPTRMPHLNCRCDFLVHEWWTDEEGNVVADRTYEIEQNKKIKGYGYKIKQGKITSKTKNGETITTFEITDDGEIKRVVYKK